MKTQSCLKCCFVLVVIFLITAKLPAQVPVITGPASVCEGTTGSYTAPAGLAVFNWTVSGGGTITSGANTSTVTVTWSTAGTWSLSVTDGIALPVFLTVTVNPLPVPTITGPIDPVTLLPATLKKGITTGQVYSTEPGMNATWTISPDGAIVSGQGTSQITVDWLTVASQQTVSVTYTDANGCSPLQPTVLLINYFPYASAIDPATIPQFVDPLPHFAAGLRINAKTGGNLLVKTVPVQQVALSTGTVLANGTIGDPNTPNAGKGNYAAYQISKDNGVTWGIPMWPAQTIEAQQGFPMTVQYENGLAGLTYDNFNILADQTLMMKGYQLIGNPLTQPYTGEIPMVVHLHGGEIPSNSDGGPNAWFMPNLSQMGPAFKFNASTLATYPNNQEAATLWFHPHDDGLTRINVYTGLAGFYFLRGADEESALVPGWSGDDLVREVTPAGKSATFNGTNAYLPEIEIAIQDRMFDVNGQLYWPVAPPNPEIHPFWTPEFIGDIFTVNGKTWPYLSVAPRRYRFRLLDGCNARWLNMWLVNAADGTPGPKITVIGGEGGLLATPVDVDPALGKTITIGPGQRYDVIIDFTGIPAGTTFTLMNDAGAPFPFGDPVVPGLTDRIMQFVVNGQLVSAADPALPGTDKSQVPANLRPVNPLVKLTDFAGGVTPGVTPAVKRQIILNEVMGIGGPAAVLVNNTYFDTELAIAGTPIQQGGPTEFMQEGTTEIVQIANVSADAHPIHIHLLQWQLVSRQAIDDIGYLAAYTNAWIPRNIPEFPAGMGYPGGAGSPFPYETINADGAVGGNPELSPFLLGPVMPALPEEMGWKDNVTVLPGQVTTFIVRVAPTDRPINALQDQLLFPFDPSLGPGYVWHCHVIDHEDMSMMRPLIIKPSPLRLPQITAQPVPVTACAGDIVTYSVTATSMTPLTYQWQISTDAGITWTNLVDGAPYAGTLSSTLSISPSSVALSGGYYRCLLTNTTGFTASTAGLLTVNNCFVSGTLKYNNATLDPLAGFTVTINGLSAVTDAAGAFTIPGITSGIYPVTVTTLTPPASINSTDAGTVKSWVLLPTPIPNVKYLSGDVDNDLAVTAIDAQSIQNYFVSAKMFMKGPWVFSNAGLTGVVNPPALAVSVAGAPVANFDILGMCTGDFNGSFNPALPAGSSNVLLTNTGLILTVPPNKAFDLPLKSVTGGQFGAVSLVLTVPSNLVTVKNVSITGGTGPVTFNMVGNELRIGWNSTTPVTIPAGGVLATLTLTPTAGFTDIQTLRIGIVASGLNEIADWMFNPVLNAELTVDDVKTTNSTVLGNVLKVYAFPNPALTTTTISYQIPVAGNVTLGVYNANGTPALMPLFVNNVPMMAGTYSLNADVSALMPGTYYITLKLVSGTKTSTKTIKFIKN